MVACSLLTGLGGVGCNSDCMSCFSLILSEDVDLGLSLFSHNSFINEINCTIWGKGL